MRPVDRKNAGNVVVDVNGANYTIVADYDPYQKAKLVLVANLGQLCSYCEALYSYPRDLQVEHIQPKGLAKYAHLETKWTNLLLSCATCNGKDNKDTKDVVLGEVHLPHLNNTFKSLVYMGGGVVMVNPALAGDSATHAEALWKLVGLDKTPKTSSPGDTRWQKRMIDWELATHYLQQYLNGGISVDAILELVKSRGGWSIWFTVFKDQDAVLARLISDFPGTCAACFDANNHYVPVDRNPGNVDPV